jgi:hypothetical protein
MQGICLGTWRVVDEWVGIVRWDPAAEAGRVRRERCGQLRRSSLFLVAIGIDIPGSGSREVFGCL